MDVESLVIQVGFDAQKMQEGLAKVQAGLQQIQGHADAVSKNIGSGLGNVEAGAKKVTTGFLQIGAQAQRAGRDAEQALGSFSNYTNGLLGKVKGFLATYAAPLAGIVSIGSTVGGYLSDVEKVAEEMGVINTKAEEQRRKKEMLSRVTKEDIELYKKGRDALAKMEYAVRGVGNELMRTFLPSMQKGVEWINKASDWVKANSENIIRFVKVLGAVIGTVLLPAILRTTAAMLANPLTWIIALILGLALVIEDLVVYIEGGESALGGFWSKFGTGEEIGRKLKDIWEKVVAVWDKCKGTLIAFLGVFAGAKIIQTVIGLVGGLGKAFQTLGMIIARNPLGIFLAVMADLIAYITTGDSLLSGFWRQFGSGEEILETLKGAWQTLSEFIDENIVFLEAAAVAFVGLNVASGVAKGVTLLAGAFRALTAAMATNPIGLVLLAITALAIAFYQLIKHWDKVVEYWKKFVAWISDGVKTLVAKFTNAFPELAQKMAGWWNDIVTGAREKWESFKATVSQKWQAIKDFVTNLGPRIVSAVTNAWENIKKSAAEKWEAIKQTVTNAWNSLLTSVTNWGRNLVNSVVNTWENIKRSAVEKWESVKATVSSKWASIRETVANLGPTIANKAKETWENVKASASEKFKSTVSEKWNAVKDTVANLGPAIAQAVSNTWEQAKSSAEQAWEAVKNTVSQKFEEAANVISNMGQNFISACQSIWSSITGFWDGLSLMESGKKLLNTFIDGIKAAAQGVIDAVKGVFDKVREYMPFSDAHVGPFSQLTLSGQRLMTTFAEGTKQGESTLLEDVSGAFTNVKNAMLGFLFGKDEEEGRAAQQNTPQKTAETPQNLPKTAEPVVAPALTQTRNSEQATPVVAPALAPVKSQPQQQTPEQREPSGFMGAISNFTSNIADLFSGKLDAVSEIGSTIRDSFSAVVDAFPFSSDMLNGVKEDFLSMGRMFMQTAMPTGAEYAMAGVSPSITESNTNQTTNTTVTTNVSGVVINTQATDAQGIANAMPSAMQGAFNRAGTSASMSGVRQ